jgi:hypothetical protein
MARPSAELTGWSNSTLRVGLPQVRSTDLVALDDALNDLTSLDE